MAEMAESIRKPSAAKKSSGTDNDIANIELQSLLFDFYGELLNENQNEVMALYHEDNLSLSEIAEDLGMSRQAVHYTLKKAEKALNGYEARLGLVAEYHRNQELAERARKIIAGSRQAIGAKGSDELLSIIEELTE